MAAIFLSYRRTDGPQACRVHDALSRRFGRDAVFMDVADIPFAVSFPDYLRDAVSASAVVLALVGREWAARIRQDGDPVRLELESAMAHGKPVLPVLIGDARMPSPDELPASIATITNFNAIGIGTLHDFDTHIKLLVQRLEAILGSTALDNRAIEHPLTIQRVLDLVLRHLRQRSLRADSGAADMSLVEWQLAGARTFYGDMVGSTACTLYLHRVARVADAMELHFIISIWAQSAYTEHAIAGWLVRELESLPILSADEASTGDDDLPVAAGRTTRLQLVVRASDEDPRQIWRMVSDERLRLSLAYVALVSPKRHDAR
jgi:hypothetical protein